GPSRGDVPEMFDRISATYDLLNRLLSFGTDILWRKKVASFLPTHRGQHVLDLATGTGDQIVALFEQNDRVQSGVGMDLAEKMLEIGRAKEDVDCPKRLP
ncbi:MAG: class I SAM-dependent methyltransferase, partial [Deltaproteobacteria bacterium]|nr:class I SAM-dependent methyltransferase [Deltaproteobacteria bacterium]